MLLFFQRMQLYSRALCLIKEQPIFGYGYGKRDGILAQGNLSSVTQGEVTCPQEHLLSTHFHNGFFTATIDAGIFGLTTAILLLLSPMIFVLQAPKDEKHKLRLAFASMFVGTYGIMGMFNILFGHDIIDSLFITGLIFLALSVIKTDGFALEGPVEGQNSK